MGAVTVIVPVASVQLGCVVTVAVGEAGVAVLLATDVVATAVQPLAVVTTTV